MGYWCRRPISLLHEPDQAFGAVVMVPVDPGNLVVLAIAIVVALLRTRKLITCKQHRGALRKKQRRQHVLHLTLAQAAYAFIVGRSFRAVVPRAVVGVAVAVILAVRLVVLVVVR